MQWLIVNCSHLHNYALEMAPDHAFGEGLVGSTLDLFRLMARTKHLKLSCRNFVRVPWLIVICKHLYHYAL